ncbi:hypothetical protein BpHYR1_050805 [Brachionus plicatilis]|uniref:Uncharacterized protein n=1 Tax=Brachionus plicatilis TaxID=10195 RepID=A0A3M7T822_BRAPC|nr:hypothetical protein BpHYR1_050805 [Brachionus plicatilis]
MNSFVGKNFACQIRYFAFYRHIRVGFGFYLCLIAQTVLEHINLKSINLQFLGLCFVIWGTVIKNRLNSATLKADPWNLSNYRILLTEFEFQDVIKFLGGFEHANSYTLNQLN